MELNSVKIQQNYKKILEDIKKYSPYPEKVKILFVSKYLNVEEHKTLIEMGYDYFGENRAQLYRDKLNEFSDEKYKNKYSIPYPKQLKENIIKRQLELIDSSMPAYPKQIKKAILRKDFVSINHRITEFLASYFDLLFAINEITHPGEKRLVQLCKKQCKILPKNFEENLNLLFSYMYTEEKNTLFTETLEQIVDNIKKIL